MAKIIYKFDDVLFSFFKMNYIVRVHSCDLTNYCIYSYRIISRNNNI